MFGVRINQLAIVASFLALHSFACTSNDESPDVTIDRYVSINGNDTATVIVNKTANLFKGSLQINYSSKYPDSGEISGVVKGDTLIGQFLYKYYGVQWQRKPVAFLMKKNRLILGEGLIKNTLDVVHFDASVPINFEEDKQFVFYLADSWQVESKP